MRAVAVVLLCFLAISAGAEGQRELGYNFIIDCSGCSAAEKRTAASTRLSASVLLMGNASQRVIDVDVTDFASDVIVTYRVTVSRSKGRITSNAVPIDVPLAVKEAFVKSLEVLDTIEFIRPGEVDISARDTRATRIRTSYPSAFDLIDDSGHQGVEFSESLNGAKWPNPESAALGVSSFGEVLNTTLPVVEDYLEGRTALVAEAKDGTFIIAQATIAMGSGGSTSILWQVAEDGLRRADGTAIRETTAANRVD